MPEESSVADGQQLSPAKILVVDDVRANLVAAEALLDPLGVRVITADSGSAALDVVSAHPDVALVLLDVMMPGMDGFATLEALRKLPQGREVPVVFVTAYDLPPEAMQRAYALGAFDYIAKPVSEAILCGKVRAFVALHNRTQQAENQRQALLGRDRNVAVLAHDLRAPLATIATCAELLPRLSSDPAKVDEAAKRIGRAAGRMERLITDLLEYGRGAALGLPVVAHPTDIGKLCTELCDELAVAQPDRRITLRLQDDLVVSCDRHRVGQALSNLIRNALQHGVGDVSMAATRSVHGVQIEVSNVGPGIPEDLLPAIFDPLARRRLGFGSLGLGLAIVREVARAHGGGVSVRSEDGRTTFQLWLPSSPPELLTEGASTPLATPHTVLVVDDDPDLRDGVSDALRAAGHEVACAADGAEAWELLGGGRALPDAIVLDVAMPVMDGVAFRRRQLADERLAGIPVVVVTSLDRLPEQGDLAARVVRKPFTIDVLERALATVYGESLRSPASAR